MASTVILLIFSIFAIFCMSSAQKQLECNKNSERRIDGIMSRILTIGNSGRKFPETDRELVSYCQETFELIKTVKNYTKSCMDNLPKQVSSVLVYTVENILNQICKKDSRRKKDLMASASCGNKASNEFNKCYQTFIDSLLGTKNAKEDKLKIPYVCCEFHKINDCMSRRGKLIDGCDDKKLETIRDFVKSLTGNILDILCGDYEDGSDKCQKLGAPPKKTKSQRRTKSFLIPMIDVLSSFPDA